MPKDRDSDERDDEHVSFDFNGMAFEERSRAEPDDVECLIVETDISRQAPIVSADLSAGFRAPRQLNVFLAHAMTELSDTEMMRCEEINSVIVKTLQRSIDPIFDIYDPGDGFDPDGDCSGIYHDDERMLFWADLLVVNHVVKADGIGMLIAQASSHGIPILSIVPEGRKLSAMYDGLPGRIWRQIIFSSFDELRRLIRYGLRDVNRSVRTRSRQREMVNGITQHDPGKQLCKCRILQGISLEELSIRTGLSARALFRLEHDRNAFLRPPHAMVWTIAQALEAEASIGSSHTTIRLPDEAERLRESFVRKSFTNLIDHVFRADGDDSYSPQEDVATVRSWVGYTEMVYSSATRERRPGGEQGYSEVVDSAEWLRRIEYFKSELC